MKKKDSLLQILKKQQKFHLTEYLSFSDLTNLCFASKKYYLQLFPILNDLKRNEEPVEKQAKGKSTNKKHKNKHNLQQKIDASDQNDVKVDVNKISLHKYAKNVNPNDVTKWKRVEQLDFKNDYLNKKIQNRTAIFFKNEETNQLIYINRSFVDPNLNYNKGGFGQDFINNNLYEHIYTEEGQINEEDFSSKEAILKRQKKILQKIELKKESQLKNQTISYEDELFRALRIKRIGIILCFGGSFSLGIFENGRCVTHKSDKKYVCRKKAGERQFNRDKQSGSSIQSMGSQIRRDQQKKHVINVGQILKQHNKDLNQCEIIFLQAPGLNRLFVINENQNLDGLQDRLRSVCLTAKKANFTQVEFLYESISQINVVEILENKDTTKLKRETKN